MIQTFLRERARYLRRVQDATLQGSAFNAVTLVASVDFDLLTSLIDLDTFHPSQPLMNSLMTFS